MVEKFFDLIRFKMDPVLYEILAYFWSTTGVPLLVIGF